MGEPGPGEVWFYQHGNYGGSCWKYRDSQASMGGANDQVSSVKLGPGASVEIFVDSNFRGSSTHITSGWNDKLSSFRIHGGHGGERGVIGQPGAPAAAPAPAPAPAPAANPAPAAPAHTGPSLDHVPVVGQKLPGAVQNVVYDKAQGVNFHGINAGDLLNKIGGHAHQ